MIRNAYSVTKSACVGKILIEGVLHRRSHSIPLICLQTRQCYRLTFFKSSIATGCNGKKKPVFDSSVSLGLTISSCLVVGMYTYFSRSEWRSSHVTMEMRIWKKRHRYWLERFFLLSTIGGMYTYFSRSEWCSLHVKDGYMKENKSYWTVLVPSPISVICFYHRVHVSCANIILLPWDQFPQQISP